MKLMVQFYRAYPEHLAIRQRPVAQSDVWTDIGGGWAAILLPSERPRGVYTATVKVPLSAALL